MSIKDIHNIPVGHIFESVFEADVDTAEGYTEVFYKINDRTCLYVENYWDQNRGWTWVVNSEPGELSMVHIGSEIIDHGKVSKEMQHLLKRECGFRIR